MKNGEFADGTRTLRAKIDMAHPNMHDARSRDCTGSNMPTITAPVTNGAFIPCTTMAHGQSDSIEKITHSICTLEFVPHRELYDWLIEKLEIYPSINTSLRGCNINYTVISKRKLLQLVNEKYVTGWDDPRMPTISGLRRSGIYARKHPRILRSHRYCTNGRT